LDEEEPAVRENPNVRTTKQGDEFVFGIHVRSVSRR
jgi:hypothetical protein